MIKAKEVSTAASKAGVNDLQIEKDYVMSWMLWGISQNNFLKENFIFKGGSLLKKAYFPDYRFAEELEFNCRENFDAAKIKTALSELIDDVHKKSGMILGLRGDVKEDANSYNIGISFSGLLGGIASAKVIRVDISKNELVYNPPVEKEVTLSYSDQINEKCSLLCFSEEEIAADKMCSLMQRTLPGDLYDFWYLLEMSGNSIEDCIFAFEEKARFKKLDPKQLVSEIIPKEPSFAKHYNEQLSPQMKIYPEFKKVWRELEKNWRRFQKFIEKQ